MSILQQSVHGKEPLESSHLDCPHESEDSLSSNRLHIRFPPKGSLSCTHFISSSKPRPRLCQSAPKRYQRRAHRVL